ncbi:MAG: hypothetical protein WB755_09225, partial [Terriglobales bacterium]
IKHVEEHHLLELIQQTRRAAGHGEAPAPSLAAAGQNYFRKPTSVPVAADFAVPLHQSADHHGEQEDYLWGV